MGLATDSAACDDPRMTLRRNATRVHREPNAGIRAASPVRVLVVGPGGRSSELPQRVFEQAIDELRQMDVEVDARQGAGLRLPVFPASVSTRSRCAESFTNTLRGADGLVVVTPGFHGCLLATIENALRYAEDLRSGGVGGLAGRAVGTVVVAATRESSDASLERLRSIVHQHDGWPTPTGVAVSAEVPDALDAADPFSQVRRDIDAVLSQVVEFARMRRHYEATRRHLIP